ncbi:uncharacterized protein LOC111703437 [Eurytemora carolleeae]|uniref:uncharacterized protein LOC111703437 n=1 Tax=Eurytemora carolleeae TaxID=1294199 RepID=UPI000C76CEDC|nr:uncharacterized protein LOC111703437 [Eurytemora carolleeae]|eukprot:XP_023331142.1 uncharacterized protein LOC111703437 [Eurytemora affinis]
MRSPPPLPGALSSLEDGSPSFLEDGSPSCSVQSCVMPVLESVLWTILASVVLTLCLCVWQCDRITRLQKRIQRLYILLREFPRILSRCCTDADARVEEPEDQEAALRMSIAVILRELEQGRNISGAEVTNGANPNPCSVFGQGDGVGQSKQLTQKEDSVDSNIQISIEKPASKVNTEKEEVDLNSPKPVVAVSVAKGLSAIVDALKEDAALKKDIDLPGCSADAATEHDPKTKIPKGDATLGKEKQNMDPL